MSHGKGIVGPDERLVACKTRWAWALGTFFGAGRMRPGPGTYGSVAAVLLWYGAAHLFHPGSALRWPSQPLWPRCSTLIGIPASTIVARESGREDPGFVVVDEVAGQWIALIAIRPDWQHAALGARALPPLRYLEAVAHPPAGGAARGHRNYAGRCGGGSAGAGGRVGGWRAGSSLRCGAPGLGWG
jgi:phosphatidylglycerophosphatase A